MNTTFSIEIEKQFYDDIIISKAIYWHTSDFIIDRRSNGNSEIITFKVKKNEISEIEKENVLLKFNRDLHDYKLRQIIERETKDIRTILYIKAFSNSDDFEEYEQ